MVYNKSIDFDINKEPELISILLHDNTTNKNIIWATDDYKYLGIGYDSSDYITSFTLKEGLLKPRSEKESNSTDKRTKDKAEVFTPSWMCNEQNNLADEAWFGRKNVFNTSTGNRWITNYKKIEFDDNRWQDYVESTRLEITCGEAPYLTSRYDTVTGKEIKIEDRIGLLDRKLRIVSENVISEKEWIEWSKKAMKSIYGFDWQGDNVLLARENLLYTYVDYYYNKFDKVPNKKLLKEIAIIISWNIWQMDGMKYVIPNSCKNEKITEISLFGETETSFECEGCKNENHKKHNGIYCKIMNWETNRKVRFETLLKKNG